MRILLLKLINLNKKFFLLIAIMCIISFLPAIKWNAPKILLTNCDFMKVFKHKEGYEIIYSLDGKLHICSVVNGKLLSDNTIFTNINSELTKKLLAVAILDEQYFFLFNSPIPKLGYWNPVDNKYGILNILRNENVYEPVLYALDDQLLFFYHKAIANKFNIYSSQLSKEDILNNRVDLHATMISISSNRIKANIAPKVSFFRNIGVVAVFFHQRELIENRFNDHILYSLSMDKGNTWGNNHLLFKTDARVYYPSLDTYKNNITLAFQSDLEESWKIYSIDGLVSKNGIKLNSTTNLISKSDNYCIKPIVRVIDQGIRFYSFYEIIESNQFLNFVFMKNGIYDTSVIDKDNSVVSYDIFYREKTIDALYKKISEGIMLSDEVSKKLSFETFILTKKRNIEIVQNDNFCEPPIIVDTGIKPAIVSSNSYFKIKFELKPDSSGYQGSCYLIDDTEKTYPDILNLASYERDIEITGLRDGIHYVHLLSVDGAGNYSPAIHIKYIIDRTPPILNEISSLTHTDGIKSVAPKAVLNLSISGKEKVSFLYSVYNTLYDTETPVEEINTRKLVLSNIAFGTNIVSVQARDQAGNISRKRQFRIVRISNNELLGNLIEKEIETIDTELNILAVNERITANLELLNKLDLSDYYLPPIFYFDETPLVLLKNYKIKKPLIVPIFKPDWDKYTMEFDFELMFGKAADKEGLTILSKTNIQLSKGETLHRILSKNMGIKNYFKREAFIKAICDFNLIKEPDLLRVGQKIEMPCLVLEEDTTLNKLSEVFFGSIRSIDKFIIFDKDVKNNSELKKSSILFIKNENFFRNGRIF